LGQSAQNLKPDFTEITASILTEQVGIQRALATGGNASAVIPSTLTHDTPFMPATRDIWLNGQWFVSLGLSLAVALISGLIKQWLNSYTSQTVGTPKRIACTRQFRYMGLSAWGVSFIIELLPLLMNTSLFLFLIGLVLFLQGFDGTHGIQIAVIALTSALFLFYLVSGFLPIVYPQCPYKSSLSQVISFSIKLVKSGVIRLLMFVKSYPLILFV
jgi:hypothetical protein